ncbi:MAG: site-2 protease family protein [Dehalococcoidales bacterium]|jgi:Zn-dependent protease/CBS domain-containing protein
MKASFKLFRIAGIDIGIHYTWIFIFVLFSWTLAQGYFPAYYEWSTAAYWITGIIASLLIFVSVLLHEMAHSLVANARGIPVHSITLFILGGVSNLEEEPQKPVAEFTMAIVGPATSLVLAAIFWGLTRLPGDKTTPVAAIISYMAYINLYLGAFNLLPGFPLDGGRVLRSIIWGATGSLAKATDIAGRVGQFFGWAFIGLGVFFIFQVSLFSGLWLAFIGWFLNSAADSSRKEITLRERLSRYKVREVMNPNIETIRPETTVSEMVMNVFRRQPGRALPVCRDDKLAGIVTITDVKKVPQEQWATTPVEKIMTVSPLYTVAPEDNLNAAMQLIARHDINQVLIKENDKCAGLLTRADIIRFIQMSHELNIPRLGN